MKEERHAAVEARRSTRSSTRVARTTEIKRAVEEQSHDVGTRQSDPPEIGECEVSSSIMHSELFAC